MLRVIQTKRSAKNGSCVFVAQIFFRFFGEEARRSKKMEAHTCCRNAALKTIRITCVHVKGAGILVINTGNTYYSSFYTNARSKTLVKSAKK